MSGQSIQDRIIAAKHSIAGQGLAKAVCKATTEEVMGPKKKHLDYLIQCTHEPNVSIPQMANLLIERTQHTSWVVVFKSLVTIHNVMNYGSERFSQYLASNNCTVNLMNFLDKTGVQGYDMSTYVRRYGKYINAKAVSYRSMAYDFCKVKRGKDDGLLRTMTTDNLLKALPVLQQQLDCLLEFDIAPNELTNGVINAAFMLLFKDLIRLFACYNDGIINLLEKFFDMPKKQCKDSLEMYKRFLARMERCADFLKIAENVGIDKGDIPDLAKAPSSLLEALEEHLKSLDGQKPKKADKTQTMVAAAISDMQSPTSPPGGASAGGYLSEEDKKKIIEEEEKQLQQLKANTPTDEPTEQRQKAAQAAATQQPQKPKAAPAQHPSPAAVKATFAPAAEAGLAAKTPAPMADLLGVAPVHTASHNRPSDDLLGLDGPDLFPSNLSAAIKTAPAGNLAPNNPFAPAAAPMSSPWGVPASGQMTNGSSFVNDTGFAAAFGGTSTTTGYNSSFGDILQPMSSAAVPQQLQQQTATGTQAKLIQGDIDSSLASLAGNLTFSATANKGQNWDNKAKSDKKLTGGTTWQGTPRATSTLPATNMFVHAPAPYGYGPAWGVYPTAPPMRPGYPPMGQPPVVATGQSMYGQPRPPTAQPNDPFGAL